MAEWVLYKKLTGNSAGTAQSIDFDFVKYRYAVKNNDDRVNDPTSGTISIFKYDGTSAYVAVAGIKPLELKEVVKASKPTDGVTNGNNLLYYGGSPRVAPDFYRMAYNEVPTLVLNTPNNATLYENDALTIAGSATDADAGNIVNVRYQINAGTIRALQTGISDGTTPIAFNKALTAKGGILYDGPTAVTPALTEGVAHTLKVWAEDDKGGKSAIVERKFFVVPNRPPAITVDAFTQKDGLINVDSITLSGTATDPDGNDVTVKYRLNNAAAVQVYAGPSGAWTFDLPLSSLIDGANNLAVEVTDIYSFKASKTITLNKNANLTSLAKSVQRYQIVPPTGSAQGVLLWVQRSSGVTVDAEISMTSGPEQEQYAPMTLANSAPVIGSIVEDEFTYQAVGAKDNIVVKLTLTGEGSVDLISGVLN